MQAQRLSAARGVIWVSAAFLLYRRGPALLTMLTMFYLLVIMACGLIQPIGPFLLPLLLPTLTVMLANGCRLLDPTQPKQPTPTARGALWRGIKQQRGPLLRLGALQLAGTLIVLGLDLLFAGGDWSAMGAGDDVVEPLHLARLLLLAAPMLLAFWFAPLLTAWDGIPAAKSLFFSLVAALRNWRAFFVYSATVLAVAAVIPALLLAGASLVSATLAMVISSALRMIMILVLAPVLVASVFTSYRDVFRTPDPDPAPAVAPVEANP